MVTLRYFFQIVCPFDSIPLPDEAAAAYGLALQNAQGDLWNGDYAAYSCTDPDYSAMDTGTLFTLECKDGEITPPTEWPTCREPLK